MPPLTVVDNTRTSVQSVVQQAVVIIPQFQTKRQEKSERFGHFQGGGVYIPKKHGVLTPILINYQAQKFCVISIAIIAT